MLHLKSTMNKENNKEGQGDALRVIISGGGTGGHIFPAVSIANAIKELRPDAQILFVAVSYTHLTLPTT